MKRFFIAVVGIIILTAIYVAINLEQSNPEPQTIKQPSKQTDFLTGEFILPLSKSIKIDGTSLSFVEPGWGYGRPTFIIETGTTKIVAGATDENEIIDFVYVDIDGEEWNGRTYEKNRDGSYESQKDSLFMEKFKEKFWSEYAPLILQERPKLIKEYQEEEKQKDQKQINDDLLLLEQASIKK